MEGSEAWLVRDKLIAKRDRRIQRRLINLGSKSIQDKINQVFEEKRRKKKVRLMPDDVELDIVLNVFNLPLFFIAFQELN